MNHTQHEKLLSAHPVDDAVRAQIMDSLRALEHQHDVKVLFACESGSRGWGFASPDSDYDVRFIYVNRPAWYLSVDPHRDVIELPISGDLDINGWDLRKALQLLKRSNPTLLEWLRSPIVYMEDVDVMTRFRGLAETGFSSLRGYHHYVSMAKKNFREHLKGEVVRYKKYLYVLRPLLAARWIREGGGVPPMRFAELAQATVRDDALLDELNRLLEVKMRAGEAATSTRWPAIHAFIESELQMAQAHKVEHDPRPDTSGLDVFLFDVVTHVEEKKNERD
ncbi:nucleotidyltransferase domain-containing protein [Aquabacterium fontiphilum]|uniref:nucleotidyltransferase domain-containing protein n=1 Tax=Aquabacterium fontiphilum TaxID=450365 RepID=UPI0013774F07|nr:nucleotidyltransferase domain-containing protein [Aquabacterium fontiphilum]NBD20492.1 nucleotidyltransferase domain-containing protein [Aquabacterium fontiphilum]